MSAVSTQQNCSLENFNVSLETCVSALRGAMMSRRQALLAELSIGLLVFVGAGGTNRIAKRILTELYASAGYQCINSSDIDYKNVNRRVNVTAVLFETLGIEKVRGWMSGKRENDLLLAMTQNLEPLQFFTSDDVADFCGRPSNKSRARKLTSDASQPALLTYDPEQDAPEGSIRIETRALHLMIPPAVPPRELIEVAMRLLDIAKATESKALSPF